MRLERWRRRVVTLVLTAALAGAPLGVARAGEPDPDGMPTLIKYVGCAVGIALAKTTSAMSVSFFLCLQMYYDASW